MVILTMKDKQPDSTIFCDKIAYTLPLIGYYDAPNTAPFEPTLKPGQGDCLFKFYPDWLDGKTLHITENHYGCGGAARYMCGIDNPDREGFLKFLVDTEGLKASRELMIQWLDIAKPVKPVHGNVMIGPLKEDQWQFLKSITFAINPDQLGMMIYGTNYNAAPGAPPAVIAPFGSGCSQLFPFEDPTIPQACIGSTDIAMRHLIPADIILFTVTKPMFKQLCELDENSFLYKPFIKNLKKSRALPVD